MKNAQRAHPGARINFSTDDQMELFAEASHDFTFDGSNVAVTFDNVKKIVDYLYSIPNALKPMHITGMRHIILLTKKTQVELAYKSVCNGVEDAVGEYTFKYVSEWIAHGDEPINVDERGDITQIGVNAVLGTLSACNGRTWTQYRSDGSS